MNEFNVLLAAATNGTPSGSLFDALFARYIAPQESWRELESPLPITILAAGEDLIDYRIFGNTENGESVGERTENLFDKDNVLENYYLNNGVPTIYNSGGYVLSDYIPIVSSTATISARVTAHSSSGAHWAVYNENKTFIRGGLAFLAAPVGTTKVNVIDTSGAAFVRVDFATDFLTDCILNPDSTAPTSYIPYGYKLSMVVRTENLYDYHNDNFGYFDVNGQIHIVTAYPEAWSYSEYILVVPGVKYIALGLGIASSSTYCCIYDKNKNLIGTVQNRMPNTEINVPYDGAYVRLSIRRVNSEYLTAEFIGTIDNPIYIGDTQLMQDEYVDFGEQKVYRMVNGTLTPTDPPVPIPALPTIQGETIIDYNPSTTPAVEPEKMYVKYKPQ